MRHATGSTAVYSAPIGVPAGRKFFFKTLAYKSGLADSDVNDFDADNRNPTQINPAFAPQSSSSSVTVSSPSSTIVFSVWDGDWAILEEYGPSNVLVQKYLQGYHGLVKTLGDNIYYYQDELGSTSHIANTSGALLEYYKYDLYGKPTYWSASGSQLPASSYNVADLFTGQRWLPRLGLYDDRNRFMSPDLGRFLQPDPIGFKGDSSNLYRYCGNDWANRSDPTGLFGCETWDRANLQNNQQDQHMGDPINMQRIQVFKPDAFTVEAQRAIAEGPRVAQTGYVNSSAGKRDAIDQNARGLDGSHAYDYGVKKDNFGVNSDKCAKFVSDVTKQAGAPMRVKDQDTGKWRSPTAGEIATQKISGWRVLNLTKGERPQPGDVAAYSLPGHATYTGHSGIIISDGHGGSTSISAHDNGVNTSRGSQFFDNPATTYQRYIGD